MNGSLAETGSLPSIDHECPRERLLQPLDDLILLEHVRNNQPAAGDVLHLAEPDRLAAEFLDY